MGVSYAALTDVRNYGISTTQAADSVVTEMLEIASRIVEDYCGVGLRSWVGQTGWFAQTFLATYTAHDIRNPILVLPQPFSMQMASPAPPTVTVTGTPGTTTYEYQCIAVNANGDSIPGIVGYTQTGNATLNGTNYNALSVAPVADATSYKWLRAGPPNVAGGIGLIGTTTGTTLNDQGQAATAYSPNVISNPALENGQVTVNGRTLAASAWLAEPWGLRLYNEGFLDVDGFPRRTATDIGYGYRGFGSPYGSGVSVTATFGYTTTPTPVKRAVVLVTAYLIGQEGVIPLDRRIGGLMVEGYQIKYDDKGQDEVLLTTGVPDADKLLIPYRQGAVMCG